MSNKNKGIGKGLDLKDFAHVSSNDRKTVLKHKTTGAFMTIHHPALKPETKASLTDMKSTVADARTPLQVDEVKHAEKFAEGGQVGMDAIKKEKYAKGGGVKSPSKHIGFKLLQQIVADHYQGKGGQEYDEASVKDAMNERSNAIADRMVAEADRMQRQTPISAIEDVAEIDNSSDRVPFAQGGNAGEQRKKIFGTQSSPSKKEMRDKHIAHILDFAKNLLGLDIVPSGGKIDKATGQRRKADAEVGVDKPDWRSGKLEAQWNPDAIVHEIAHLILLPEGVGLKEGQTYMDKQYSDVQKKYGYMKQKQSQGEIQPMAVEQILRRHLGLPANKNSVPVKNNDPEMPLRAAVEDPTFEAGTRVKKGDKWVDLIRQSRFLTPENKAKLEAVMSGQLKFDHEQGWLPNMDAMGAKVAAYKEQNPQAVRQSPAMPPSSEDIAQAAPMPPSMMPQAPQPQVSMDQTPVLQPDPMTGMPMRKAMAEGGESSGGMTPRQAPQTQRTEAPQTGRCIVIPDKGYGKIIRCGMAGGGEVKVPHDMEPKSCVCGSPLHANMADGGPVRTERTEPTANAPGKCIVIPDKGWGKIIRCGMANGGEVAIHRDANPKHCMNCGGPVHMYAEGTPGGTIDPEQSWGPSTMSAGLSDKEKELNALTMMRSLNRPDAVYSASDRDVNSQITTPGQFPSNPDLEAARLVDNRGKWDVHGRDMEKVQDMERQAQIAQAANEFYGQKPQQPQLDQAAMAQEAQGLAPQPAAAPQQPQSGVASDPYGMLMQGIQEQRTGLKQGANVVTQQAAESQKILEQQAFQQQQADQEFQKRVQDNMAEYQATRADMEAGFVSPEKFWTGDPRTGEGGHSKIMAGIGMILAGFNPTTNPNAAINFLKFQMEQNLKAQETNLNAKNNLLAANLRQFGNIKDAAEWSRIQMKEMAAVQLQQAAAKYQGQAAQAAALQASGQLTREAAGDALKFSMMRAAFGGTGDESDDTARAAAIRGMMMVNPGLAQDMQSKNVPGYSGWAKTPVSPENREKLMSHNNLEDQAQYLKQFITQYNSLKAAADPRLPSFLRSPEYTKAQQMVMDLQTAIREGKLGTVYKEGEQPLLDKYMKSNPVSIFQSNEALNQIDEILRSNAHHRQIIEEGVGLPPRGPRHAETKEPQYKTVNGVKYMRGPKGEAIPVR